MRILIAEDDAALRGLEAEFYAVDVFFRRREARALAVEFDYDLIVLRSKSPAAGRGEYSPSCAQPETQNSDRGASARPE